MGESYKLVYYSYHHIYTIFPESIANPYIWSLIRNDFHINLIAKLKGFAPFVPTEEARDLPGGRLP